jgi:hypothetical protein
MRNRSSSYFLAIKHKHIFLLSCFFYLIRTVPAINPEINNCILCLILKSFEESTYTAGALPEEVPIKTTSKSEPSVVTTWGSTSRAVKPVYSPETRKKLSSVQPPPMVQRQNGTTAGLGLLKASLCWPWIIPPWAVNRCSSLLWIVWRILEPTYAGGHSDTELLKGR